MPPLKGRSQDGISTHVGLFLLFVTSALRVSNVIHPCIWTSLLGFVNFYLCFATVRRLPPAPKTSKAKIFHTLLARLLCSVPVAEDHLVKPYLPIHIRRPNVHNPTSVSSRDSMYLYLFRQHFFRPSLDTRQCLADHHHSVEVQIRSRPRHLTVLNPARRS